MNARRLSAPVVILLILTTGTRSFAGGWYAGGGISVVAPRKELAGIETGPGIAFKIDRELTNALDLGAQAGISQHISSGVNVYFTNISLGPAMTVDLLPSFSARISAGLSYQVINFDDVNIRIDGSGHYLGVGVEKKTVSGRTLGFEIQSHSLDGEDNFGNKIDGLSLTGVFYFRSGLSGRSAISGSD